MKRDGKATRAVCIALLASGFLSKREAQAFPLAPSAGDVPPAPSPQPGIPQAWAIENLCLHYRTHEHTAHISPGANDGQGTAVGVAPACISRPSAYIFGGSGESSSEWLRAFLACLLRGAAAAGPMRNDLVLDAVIG